MKVTKKQAKTIGVVVGCIALVVLGVSSTLAYQNFISNVKKQGAAEYRINSCAKYSDPKTNETWLECDE